jgi:hypothetical protein
MPVYLPGLTFGGLGYGGASYGYSPYGSGVHPRLPVPVDGGYGGAPYGLASYGSVDITPPRLTGASSIDGYRVEVFFNEDMADDATLLDPTNYVFAETVSGASTFGAPLTATSVATGTPSGLGYSSVVVTHTGSTLGGQYTVTVTGPTDVAGNPIGPPPTNSAVFYALGDETRVYVSLPDPDDGRTVVLDFYAAAVAGQYQPLMSEASFSPGVDDTVSYGITTTYPVTPTIGAATQDAAAPYRVALDVHPMTSAVYDLIIGPSEAFAYSGVLLPDDDPSFTGAEIGTGSSAASNTGLMMSKAAGVQYGWSFGDSTGRMADGTTFNAEVKYNLTSTTVLPAVLNSTLATFSVFDGVIQVDMTLADVAGVKVIQILSGGYSSTVLASWDTASQHSVALIRNQKGNFYTVVFDGVPLNTFPVASATGAPNHIWHPSGAGTAFVLSAPHAVSLFRLSNMGLSSSLTLFTTAWNFIHGLPISFTGSSVLAMDKVTTRYGPLVRGWGDATPATKQDVEVRLDGGIIDISGVNPYVGEIYPTIPIPRAVSGTFTVDVDYIWFVNPAMELAGLNTRGLTLSTWDRSPGHDAESVAPLPDGSTGATRTNRFPMGVALGPYERPSPKRIGHKYIGWQKDYSALTNTPTTLLLNRDPHAISVDGLSADALAGAGIFDGSTTPQAAPTPWVLDGVDTGASGTEVYTLVDASAGPYGVGTAAFYKRTEDLSLDTHVSESVRFRITAYEADGVFTGVGAGLHDGAHLAFVGALVVDGVSHVGILTDASIPHLAEGWDIGPSALGTGVSQTVVRIAYGDFPTGFGPGQRLRIGSGSQSGVYTVAECGIDLDKDGNVLITLTTALPTDIHSCHDDTFTLYFETPWTTELISLRMSSVFPTGSLSVFLGGALSGTVGEITDVAAFPAQTSLLLPASEKGVVFWGSLSRRATSTSIWDLAQYSSVPQLLVQTAQGITALTEMNVTPPEDPNDPWFLVGGFGTAVIDATGDQLLLKATSDESPIDTQFYYERVEPFINPKVRVDSEATFSLDSASLGVGSAALRIRDTEREALVETIWLQTDSTGHSILLARPRASLSGLRSPEDAGWTPTTSPAPPTSSVFVRGQTLEMTKKGTDGGHWRFAADLVADATDLGAIIEARLSVQSFVVGTHGIGVTWGAQVRLPSSNLERSVGVTLDETAATKEVTLVDRSGVVIAAFPLDWSDSEYHSYRVLCDPVADLVVVVVDDVVLGSVAFSDFSSLDITPNINYLTSYLGYLGSGVCQVTLDSLSAVPLRTEPTAGDKPLIKTFGVRLRLGAEGDINSYRLPRTDGTGVPNSHLAASFKEMDWTAQCRVRMFLDPTWGVSVYRPDLPLPPGATEDFATETTDPSAAWINVEYRDLPVYTLKHGSVSFGAINEEAISQQRWDSVRYRVRGGPEGFGIAPQGMVLNRAFTLTSGEFNLDVTPETVTVTSRTPYLVYIPDGDIYADRMFVVQVDGAVIAPALYSFDKDTQNLQFASTAPLPGAHYPVTVTFAVGKPITKTYLCGQPIDETVTVLNEGTPPIPSDLDQPSDREIESGGIINDPADVLDEAESLVLNDPSRVITFTDTADSIYADLQFCTTEDGESVSITPICDGPGPGLGLSHVEVDGHFTTNAFTVPEGPGGPWKGSPSIKGSATHFNPSTVLTASGGNILGGNLGPGTAILYPNQRGPSGKPPAGGMGINQDFALRLSVQAVVTDATVSPVVEEPLEEDLSIDTMLGDNVPPTYAEPVPSNPDAAPTANGHGGAAYTMTDYATVTTSRLGPWGGLTALETHSLLAGGAQLNGSEFILEGGTQIPGPVVTTGYIRAAL